MRYYISWLALIPVFSLGNEVVMAQTVKPGKPNIVVILADDLGFSDLGCYGAEIQTPNLDKLAAGGLRCTQFYNTTRCCPSRAALLTGLYAHQAGVGHMTRDLGTPSYQGFLNDRCVTIAEALRQGGYRTLMSGKWDVGFNRPHWPVDRGFDRFFGVIGGPGTNYFGLNAAKQMAKDDKPYTPADDGFYMTNAITDEAVAFLDQGRPRKEPFFLYVAYTAPHSPLHALPEDIARYQGKYMAGWDALRRQRLEKMTELGIVDKKWPLTPRDPAVPAWVDVSDEERKSWDLKMAIYAAQIECMDRGIGKIVAKIKALGAEDNTLCLFLSDNGGCVEEENRGKPGLPPGHKESHFSYGRPWANVSNTPFRLYKWWVHEGGIATPLIAHWPAVIAKRGIDHQPGHVIDIMATCLDVAGVAYPKTFQDRSITPLEGKSLLPILRGKTREGHDALYWEHQGQRAVRQGKWKLVSRRGSNWELYDVEADRVELNDLAQEQPDKVKDLAAKYDHWAQRCGVVPWEKLKQR